MNKVLIVDDETIIRVTLRSLTDWEERGYTVVKDCMNGLQALEYLRENPVDLMITDMKMPGMDGLQLMETVSREGRMPVTLILSGYNEFELVRDAFRMGAYDYLLKSDLNARALEQLLDKLNRDIFKGEREGERHLPSPRAEIPKEGLHGIVLFEVTDFKHQAGRFSEDIEEKMVRPMIELARQIPRVAARGGIMKVYPSQFLLYYRVTDENQYRSSIVSLTRQIQAVWRDYMNLETLAAVSLPAEYEDLDQAVDDDIELLKWGALYGRTGVCCQWDFASRLSVMSEEKKRSAPLIDALFFGDELALENERRRFLDGMTEMDVPSASELCLHMLCHLAERFKKYDNDFMSMFPEPVDYYQKVGRLKQIREMELWVNNYIRWVSDYLYNYREDRQTDVIARARRFLADNFASEELTLRIAADYVGLNEKYFSSKFTKETGMTFSAYLTGLRLEKARQLMETTDLRIYEISDRVGYRNVEHFNRMFKKHYGISPGDYKKTGKKENI